MAEETPASKLPHTKIDIKPPNQEQPPPPPPPPSSSLPSFSAAVVKNNSEKKKNNENDPEEEEGGKFPYFMSRYRQRASDTWLISLLVILHLLAFITTMLLNYFSLGTSFFQPLSENPLLGPSASTLDRVGAVRRALLAQTHQAWRLFTCPWLHAGLIHFAINISCIIFVGIHLERDYGPLRIGIIYLLSAYFGSLVCSLFVRNSPAVASSAALFGLLGAMLSGIIRNWKVYVNKGAALAVLFAVFLINFILGLLPFIDNFANIGAFISGLLLGFVLLFTPQIRQFSKNKTGLYECSVKSSIDLKLKLKLDRPILRTVSFVLFVAVLAGCLAALLLGIDVNHYCGWCRFVDCIPSKKWSCNDRTNACSVMRSNSDLTLTCLQNGNSRVFPYTNVTQSRITDLCSMIC